MLQSQLDEAIDMLGVKITSKPRTKAARMELLRAFAVQHAAVSTHASYLIPVSAAFFCPQIALQ